MSDTCEVDAGATACTSGATDFDCKRLRVGDGESRRRTETTARAGGARRAPRRDHEDVRAQLVDLVLDLGFRAFTDSHGEHDGRDADQDAEHRERGAQPMGANGFGRGAEDVAPGHRVGSSS